jgi:hypothetical protein
MSMDNQRSFLEQFAKKNNITKLDDWYSITNRDVLEAGGNSLLHIYKGSLHRGNTYTNVCI